MFMKNEIDCFLDTNEPFQLHLASFFVKLWKLFFKSRIIIFAGAKKKKKKRNKGKIWCFLKVKEMDQEYGKNPSPELLHKLTRNKYELSHTCPKMSLFFVGYDKASKSHGSLRHTNKSCTMARDINKQ